MKRIRFEFKSSGGVYPATQEFVTPELPDEEADAMLLVLGKCRRVDVRYVPGTNCDKQAFVAQKIDGFSVQLVEPEIVIPLAEYLRLSAEESKQEMEAKKKKAEELAAADR